MIIELCAGGFLIGSYIYHRLTEPPDKRERGALDLPITDEGAPFPHVFGRCRVTTPILAWGGPVTFDERGTGTGIFELWMELFLVLGIGFRHGDGISAPIASNHVHSVYVGDQKLGEFPLLSSLTGNGMFEAPSQVSLVKSDYSIVGNVEFLHGGPAQVLVNGGATTNAGARMLANGFSEPAIPGYRGSLSVCLYAFNHGRVNGLPSYQFEASSYGTNHAQLGPYAQIADDANPVSVIYEILTSPHLLGLPESIIDMTTFLAAAITLRNEGHGYSRFWNERTSAADMINEVLRQIDAIVYFEQRTSKICIRLARADYSTPDLLEINRSNCVSLTGFSMGGRTNLVNKVRVTYLDRVANYHQKSVTAQNMANAVGQDGQVAEEVIDYPGCCTAALALQLAERELEVRSRPMVKFRALVKRSFLRVNPGDVVRVVWTNPDVAGAVMRVVNVERGTLEDSTIALDLILDSAYVWRNDAPKGGGFGGIDTGPVLGG